MCSWYVDISDGFLIDCRAFKCVLGWKAKKGRESPFDLFVFQY